MRDEIAIVVVLYFDMPQQYLFENLGIHVVIIDNTPDRNLRLSQPHVTYLSLGDNYGIAKALNVGFAISKELGVRWVLTMDQDSLLPPNMIDEYINFLKLNPHNVGVLAPLINMYDGEQKKSADKTIEISEALTSGSLIKMEAYDLAGGFKEEMFIDSVDFEFCWNIRQIGYKVIQINRVVMQHHLGNTKEYRLFGKHLFYITNHSALRHYYMSRNSRYLRHIHSSMVKHPYLDSFRRIKGLLKIILFENNKQNKLKAIYLGYRDFKHGIMGKCNYNL